MATSFENGDTVDGVVLATGDRILLKDQATASENGAYTVNASGAPTRATDYDSSDEVILGSLFYVKEGTANGGKFFYLSAPTGTITLGSSNLTFTEQSSTFNIGGLSSETVMDASVDYLAFYDDSAASTKKILLENLAIEGLTDLGATVDSTNDEILVYDNSAGILKRTAPSNVVAAGGVANGGNTGSYTGSAP